MNTKHTELRKYIRRKGGIQEAAKVLGCCQSYLYHILNGVRPMTAPLARKIAADAPRISMNKLIMGE